MATGLEIRAGIDQENIRALLLIHGGASIALLAFLPVALRDIRLLVPYALLALGSYQIGLVLALLSTVFRRKCSLNYEGKSTDAEKLEAEQSGACRATWGLLWASIAVFPIGSFWMIGCELLAVWRSGSS
jgi:hypothetical protein